MSEVGLQGSGIVALVRQREPAGMAQHVRMDLELETGRRGCSLKHPGKPGRAEWRPTLRDEHERTGRRFTLQPAQRAQLEAG
jgi:hypothetical protein